MCFNKWYGRNKHHRDAQNARRTRVRYDQTGVLVMMCSCRGDHHQSQHARITRLNRQFGVTDMTEQPLRGHNTTTAIQCGHNANGEFEVEHGEPGKQCMAEATSATVFRDWDGKQRIEYRCNDRDHLALLWDAVEANPNANARVLSLVDVTHAAIEEDGRVDIRIERTGRQGVRDYADLITWEREE